MKKTLTLLSLVLALCLAFGACTASPVDQPDKTDDSVPTGDQDKGDIDDGEVAPPEDPEETAPVEGSDPVEVEAQVLTGAASGFGGNVTATVSIDETGVITDVTVEAPNETEGIGSVAAPKVAESIVEAQSVNVDTVSGATLTSNAVIEAVTNALTEAGVIDSYNK